MPNQFFVPNRRNVVYLAGPYAQGPAGTQEENIQTASEAAQELWKLGYTVYSPHRNTAFFEEALPELSEKDWLSGHLEMLVRCDVLVLLPKWLSSSGAREEKDLAVSLNIPVFKFEDFVQKAEDYLEWKRGEVKK